MTKMALTLAAGALALVVAAGASAQPAATDPNAAAQPDAAAPTLAPPAAPRGQDVPTGRGADMNAPSAGAAGVDSSATQAPVGVETIRQGDSILVTNGPVPDTAANRAKYGGPMSMTGKRTKPAGN